MTDEKHRAMHPRSTREHNWNKYIQLLKTKSNEKTLKATKGRERGREQTVSKEQQGDKHPTSQQQ